jgi:carbon storage regulator
MTGDKVRLGIEAPKDIPVHRHEIFIKVMANNQVANRSVCEKGD